jgi:peroxiredoxin (alkyl hydroperoxide reductase subunit C)
MLTVGDTLPSFELQALVGLQPGKEFQTISDHTYSGKWLVVFFWPMDFTFVCPTEIIEFSRRNSAFVELGAQVLGASVDTQYVHLAWRSHHPGLRDVAFPMLADTRRELSQALGVLHRCEGVALRATFIVDPDRAIRWASVNDLNVGRNVEEVLRVLAAIQTEKLTPCNWQQGDPTLQAA